MRGRALITDFSNLPVGQVMSLAWMLLVGLGPTLYLSTPFPVSAYCSSWDSEFFRMSITIILYKPAEVLDLNFLDSTLWKEFLPHNAGGRGCRNELLWLPLHWSRQQVMVDPLSYVRAWLCLDA